jgi:hypothetical protein
MLHKARQREVGLSHSAEETLAARDDAESGQSHANYRAMTSSAYREPGFGFADGDLLLAARETRAA